MQDWTRVIWASPDARAVWEPRLQRIQAVWAAAEVASVARGRRQAALVFGRPDTTLSMAVVAPNRYAVGQTPATTAALASAYLRSDDEAVGSLLGYPACCRAFFARTWAAGALDTTAQMAGDGNGPVESNILGRWLGVRFVPHLPCSWTCAATVRGAATWLDLWPIVEHAWAAQILDWPAQWSARHGIAEVVFPVLKLSTRTTPGTTAVVQRRGAKPAEAATGLTFPFAEPRRLLQLESATLNGFATHAAMRAAHAVLLETLAANPPQGLVVDLGCGTGALMRAVLARFDDIPVFGVEVDPARAGGRPEILVADLHHLDVLPTNADTFLVSQRRFEEIPALEAWCAAHARQVLVYSYDPPTFAEMRKVA